VWAVEGVGHGRHCGTVIGAARARPTVAMRTLSGRDDPDHHEDGSGECLIGVSGEAFSALTPVASTG
jgi:hypothetical protein